MFENVLKCIEIVYFVFPMILDFIIEKNANEPYSTFSKGRRDS
jgi:hypothetical protein